MNFLGLIDNTALLLGIAKKNPAPTDKVASGFLKSKRNLGSNDRRFILDLLFFTIRNYTLIEYLASEINKNTDITNYFSKNVNISSKKTDFLKVLTAVLLIINLPNYQKYQYIFGYLNKKEIQNSSHFTDIILSLIQNSFNLTNEVLNNWIKNLNNYYDLIENSFLENIKKSSTIDDNTLKYISLYNSFPEWIINNILKFKLISIENLSKLTQSFTENAPITIRISKKNLANIDKIKEYFKKENVELTKCQLSPVAYNLSKRIYQNESTLYKNGSIEIQDEASQLVSYALAPEENWVILDACAGAGGKSLHLADLQNDNGLIIALDKEYNRLKEIPRRAKNSGYCSILTYIVDEKNYPKVKDKNIKFFNNCLFDAVLIDAPCSGMGTLRRDPMKKYRTTPRLIEKLSEKQYEILEHYSQFLKADGVLVYATCSILPEENELVIEKFLKNHPEFIPDPLINAFSKHNIVIPDLSNEFCYTFYPHLYGTDGFFIARMKKVKL